MKHTFSVQNKNEAIYYNRKVYDSEFGNKYDDIHNLSPKHYTQKVFSKNVESLITKLTTVKDKLNLIDVGTGTGSLSLHYYKFLRPSDTVVNLDISENMLSLLKRKLTQQQIDQSQFIADDAYAYLSRTDLNFDLIGFAGCLHHFFDYQDVLEQAFKKLAPNGYLYIALEPRQLNSYLEGTIRNFEAIISRYKKAEFGLTRFVIKMVYTPFHFLNRWFGINKKKTKVENDDFPDQGKSEVITSGLDMDYIFNKLKIHNIKVINYSGGPDYSYPFTFKLLNLLHLNSHFQLIAQKENEETGKGKF